MDPENSHWKFNNMLLLYRSQNKSLENILNWITKIKTSKLIQCDKVLPRGKFSVVHVYIRKERPKIYELASILYVM